MKKVFSIFILCVLLLSSFNVYADTKDEGKVHKTKKGDITITSTIEPINRNIEVKFIDETKLDKNRLNSLSGGDRFYLYSKYKWKYDRLISSDSKSEINQKHVAVVTPGVTYTTTKSTTTYGSVSFEGSYSTKVKEAINLGFGLNATGSFSTTVSENITFEFHDKYNDTNYTKVDFYIAVGFDKYKVILEKIDVYQVDVGNWGFQTEEVSDGEIITYSHRPKRAMLEKPGYNN